MHIKILCQLGLVCVTTINRLKELKLNINLHIVATSDESNQRGGLPTSWDGDAWHTS